MLAAWLKSIESSSFRPEKRQNSLDFSPVQYLWRALVAILLSDMSSLVLALLLDL